MKQNKLISSSAPNYRLIYIDMINMKYPEKIEVCKPYLIKEQLSEFIIKLNELIVCKQEDNSKSENQKFRSYSRQTIINILDFQKKSIE